MPAASRVRRTWWAALAAGVVLAACSVGGSAAPTSLTQPNSPTQADQAAQPGQPTQADQAAQPTQADQATQPGQPTQPGHPTQAAQPGQPGRPAQPAASTPTPAARVQAIVVLDPGHNGGSAGRSAELTRQVPNGRGGTKDCNTTGTATDAGYAEHAFNFDVAQRVRELLAARGVTVVLTRPDDTGLGPCVDERGTAGQRANADAVVSIHADGAAASGRGFHVAYSTPPLNNVQRGPAVELARALRDAMSAAGLPTSNYTGLDGMSPRADLAGLNLAERPAALVECANMRNAAEATVISTPQGRQRYAEAIAAGVLAFLARR